MDECRISIAAMRNASLRERFFDCSEKLALSGMRRGRNCTAHQRQF